MKKKIIISCQFGTDPEKTIDYGVKLAKLINAQVKLVWTVTQVPIVSTGLYPRIHHSGNLDNTQELEKSAKDTMAQIAGKYNPDGGQPVITQSIFQKGEPVNTLEQIAENENADLVLCGMEANPDIIEDLFGTQTTRLAEKALAPVLAVPSTGDARPPRKILIASPIDQDQLYSLRKTVKLFKDLNPKITLLNFSEETPGPRKIKNEAIVKAYQKMTGHTNIELFNVSNNHYQSVIQDLVNLDKPDLVVFQPTEMSFFSGLSNSSATTMIRAMDRPVLIL